MNYYFPIEKSIYSKYKTDTRAVIHQMIERYHGDNPLVPVTYHIYPKGNFHITEDYLDEVKLHEKFPKMENESYAYAWAKLDAMQEGMFHLRLGVYGPVFLYVNGELCYRSSLYGERFSDSLADVAIPLKRGSNSLLFLCIKTPLGCGIRIGSSSYKGRRIQFFAPSKERKGMGGFIYSEPVKKPLSSLPKLWDSEKTTGLSWYPDLEFNKEEEILTPTERIFVDPNQNNLHAASPELNKKYLVYTKVETTVEQSVSLSGQVSGEGKLYIKSTEDETLLEKEVSESFTYTFPLKEEIYQVALFGVKPVVSCKEASCPVKLEGNDFNKDPKLQFLYAGPFSVLKKEELLKYLEVRVPMMTEKGMDFWYVDKKSCRVRPYNEGVNFGEWSYPLGVTLYGMLQAGRVFEEESVVSYVGSHFEKAAGFYEYCMWDKEEYGAAPFHNQITTLDCLDDCGSFGSAMLEYKKDHDLYDGEVIAKVIGDFIKEKQYRLTDGTFYRDHCYLPIMNKTVWADDMYMSIPFLCRYYQKTKEDSYLAEVIHQVKRFYHYLFMPELQIMSHIYDVNYSIQTKVPWGRGNGWTIFSITELLEVLSPEHKEYSDIIQIYRTLCQGYLSLQDNEGMWHQVLTMPESYPETSCTAMFVYAFSRGVRYGWFEENTAYENAALKGWEALCKTSIDQQGNLFGVCRGSGYSFSKEYYANDLTWNINDNHGTGIVILAGVEVEKMKGRNMDATRI